MAEDTRMTTSHPTGLESLPAPRWRKSRSRRGASLIETLIALSLAAVFLSCNYAANSRVWALVRASLESNSANRALNGRSEQLRSSTWAQVTSAGYLNTTIFATAPDANDDLGDLVETIDVIAQPLSSVQSLKVTRNNTTRTATTVNAGDGSMPGQTGIRVNLTANWTAKGGRSRTRQISLFFAQGGISGTK